ncbi:MAG: stage III sporulation protein AB [Clostridia bacterium]|nr:stage III sporulation protein AB [Clostridia bacterium]
MKIAGCVLILFSGLSLGVFLKRQLKARTEIIADLILSLTALQNEITFARAPLEEAFYKLSRIDGPVGRFYLRCRESMILIPRPPVFTIWESSLQALFSPIVFASREYDAMLSLGRDLGAGDAVAQIRSISYAKEELSQIMISAREEEKKRTRMYMGLSVIAAAIIAIAAL